MQVGGRIINLLNHSRGTPLALSPVFFMSYFRMQSSVKIKLGRLQTSIYLSVKLELLGRSNIVTFASRIIEHT